MQLERRNCRAWRVWHVRILFDASVTHTHTHTQIYVCTWTELKASAAHKLYIHAESVQQQLSAPPPSRVVALFFFRQRERVNNLLFSLLPWSVIKAHPHTYMHTQTYTHSHTCVRLVHSPPLRFSMRLTARPMSMSISTSVSKPKLRYPLALNASA